MKKILYLVVCMLLIGTIANAQTKDSAKLAHKERRMNDSSKQKIRNSRLSKNLDMTDDQKKQMDDIHSETQKQKEAIENDKSLTAEQKQQKIKDLNKQQKSKMRNVLTPEQRQKLQQERENRRTGKDSSSTK